MSAGMPDLFDFDFGRGPMPVSACAPATRTMRPRRKLRQAGVDVVVGDICTFNGDVIVNAANPPMLGGGGVDGAIHRAAGPLLRQACEDVWADASGARCPTGAVRPTPAYDLPAKWVFHTTGPFMGPGASDKAIARALAECFERVGELAHAMGLHSVALPAISTGAYGVPMATCARVGIEWATCVGLDVTFYLFDAAAVPVWQAEMAG